MARTQEWGNRSVTLNFDGGHQTFRNTVSFQLSIMLNSPKITNIVFSMYWNSKQESLSFREGICSTTTEKSLKG